MKTITKITAAAVLAIAAAAPAFAKDKPVRHTHAMSHMQRDEGTRAQAYMPPTQPTYDPAHNAADY
jgi:hypothetical protein